jgi:hypothetical protein
VENWDIFEKVRNNEDLEVTTEIDWEQLENPESTQENKEEQINIQPSPLETIPETTEPETEEQGDTWGVTLAEPVDWAKELGATQPTEEEQQRIDKEWEESEAAWAREPVPSPQRTTSWKDIPFPHRFMAVFDESTRPKRLRRNQEWLTELPGGASDTLDFLQILDLDGARIFLQQGDWSSKYGFVSQKDRERLYYGRGKNWYKQRVIKPAQLARLRRELQLFNKQMDSY